MSNAVAAAPSEPEWAAWAAIDWADQKNFWRLLPAGSRQSEAGELDNPPEAVEVWAANLQQRFGGRPIKGILYKTPNGYIQQSPFFSMVNNCIDIVTKLSREFGLTPAARSRMVAQTETEPEDDLWTILNAPRERVYPSQPEPKPQ